MTQLEQILKLSELGYTKDEITALMVQPVQQPTQAPPVQQPTQAQPAQQPTQAQPVTNNVDFLEALKLLGQTMVQPAQPVVQQAQPVVPAPTVQPAQPVVQPAQPVVPAPTVQQQAPTQAQPAQQQPSISLSADDLVKLTQGMAVHTAAGSIETPKSANDIILGMLDAYESTVKKED